MNKNKISLILGTMCLLLTIGICVQIKTVNRTGTTVSTNSKENELRDAVLKEKEKYDNLYEELEEMEKQLEKERTNSTQNNTELEQLENDIKEKNKLVGLSEVQGEGIIITLNDSDMTTLNNDRTALSDFIVDPNWVLVHDKDLINIVNDLKNVGAEAICINDQRIITTSSIDCDGSVIMINGEKIAAPFVIKAIGLPSSLKSIEMYGRYLYKLKYERFLDVKVETSDTLKQKITIPKYTGVIKFEYAKSK